MTAQCGGDHEGPCTSMADVLFSSALERNMPMLFAVVAECPEGQLDTLAEIGATITAAAMAMKAVRAEHDPDEIAESAAMAGLVALLGDESADLPDDVNGFLASLGLSTEDGQEPEQQG